jgi:Uncharacterized protein conserved in bacteria
MDSLQQLVIKLERELLDPAIRADSNRLSHLIADDFWEVGATGRSFGKADVLARLPHETGIDFLATAMEAHVLAPNVVLVTYTAERTHEGRATCSLRSSVWVSNGSVWQMRYHQGTNVDTAA